MKKGGVPMQVGLIALAVVILVVLIIILRDQLTAIAAPLKDFLVK